ncbi:SIS domain-containing protein [Sediminibacterium sp. C3]|uniref:D-sedoheptulose-7-phosphate isomerase n=1 Tax=Sediminibacterium sp. C3 TaxID=1267211 RepID=UPI00040669D9|nr:D-sedoheptulose 7-phosphate isomerase [Sediminibacterium sp. C3]
MLNKINHIISESIQVKQSLLNNTALLEQIACVVDAVTTAFKNGHKVQFCGNGGSAADAQHLAAEFSGRFYKNRTALPSDALHCNSSYLTAVANDYGYDEVYSRLVDGTMQEGDILIGLSTSGNSPNIVKAFETARAKNIITVGFTGNGGGKLGELSHFLLDIPSKNTPRIQESHIMIGHIICELVEANLFP